MQWKVIWTQSTCSVHRYFSFFRKTVLQGPGPVLRTLAPKLREKVAIDTSIFERWSRR